MKRTAKLPEIHIDIASHNARLNNPSPRYSVYLPEGGGFLSHRDKTEFTKRTAQKYAREFAEKHGQKTIVVPADEPAPRSKNPIKPRSPSRITGKAPSKRLVARRKKNDVPGYYPNPIDGGVELLSEIQKALTAAVTRTKFASKRENDLTRQARISYAQGLVLAAKIMGVINHATYKADMKTLEGAL